MKTSEIALRVLMACVAVFHAAVGCGLNLGGEGFVKTMAGYYGAAVPEWSPQFMYILKPLGGFMLALGLAAAATAWRPRPMRPMIYVFVGLFVLRALHRLLDGETISTTFGIDSARNIGNMVFFFGLAAVLVAADIWAHGVKLASSDRRMVSAQ